MRTGQKWRQLDFFNFSQLQVGSSQPIKGLPPKAANESKVNAHWLKFRQLAFLILAN
jgi:hypothetical protein